MEESGLRRLFTHAGHLRVQVQPLPMAGQARSAQGGGSASRAPALACLQRGRPSRFPQRTRREPALPSGLPKQRTMRAEEAGGARLLPPASAEPRTAPPEQLPSLKRINTTWVDPGRMCPRKGMGPPREGIALIGVGPSSEIGRSPPFPILQDLLPDLAGSQLGPRLQRFHGKDETLFIANLLS